MVSVVPKTETGFDWPFYKSGLAGCNSE